MTRASESRQRVRAPAALWNTRRERAARAVGYAPSCAFWRVVAASTAAVTRPHNHRATPCTHAPRCHHATVSPSPVNTQPRLPPESGANRLEIVGRLARERQSEAYLILD